MFTIPKNKINYIKENGIYDYIIDIEEQGNLNSDDKEEIYQYFLTKAMVHMTKKEYFKFIDGLASHLESKIKKCMDCDFHRTYLTDDDSNDEWCNCIHEEGNEYHIDNCMEFVIGNDYKGCPYFKGLDLEDI